MPKELYAQIVEVTEFYNPNTKRIIHDRSTILWTYRNLEDLIEEAKTRLKISQQGYKRGRYMGRPVGVFIENPNYPATVEGVYPASMWKNKGLVD